MISPIWILLTAITSAGQTAPTSFEELSSQAQQAYEANHDEAAAELYAAALKLRPEWAQGWWALGMIDYQHDRYVQCRDELTRMVALDASAAPGWALLGLCEYETKQYDAALQHLKQAHMLVPAREGGGPLLDIANYHLAMLLTRQGAFEVAQEIFVRVALKNRDNHEMMFASGLAALRMPIFPADVPANQREVVAMAGKAFWALMTQPPEQAAADFKALATAYPTFPNVHYFYGTFLAARHPEQADAEFLAELHVTPNSVPARVQLVLRYIIEARLKEALKLAKEAVALSPDSVGAQLALAEAQRAQSDNAAALAAYLQAERLDPDSPRIRLYLMNAYRALGRTEDLRREQAEYNRLKAQQPNWP